MKYAWKIVAGKPGKPGGVVGLYQTKNAARAAWPRYSAYLVRVLVTEDTWQDLAEHPKRARYI